MTDTPDPQGGAAPASAPTPAPDSGGAVDDARPKPPEAQPASRADEINSRDAVARALDRVQFDDHGYVRGDDDAAEGEGTPQEAAPKGEAQPKAADAPSETAEEGQRRGPDGKFLPKEPPTGAEGAQPAAAEAKPPAPPPDGQQPPVAPAEEPPSNLNLGDAEKAAWSKAPPEVRAAVTRRVSELETGLGEYQKLWEPVKPWHDLAQQYQTTVPEALQRYTAFEKAINQDPVRGLELVCQDMGLDFRAIAEHVAGQSGGERQRQPAQPGQPAQAGQPPAGAAPSPEVNALRGQVQQLQQQLQQITAAQQQQAQQATLSEVETFAKAHPRFDELGPRIAGLIRGGLAATLPEAYSMAERLHPAPATASQGGSNPPAPAQGAQEQTPTNPARTRAQASVAGAPDSGSDPVQRKPSKSTAEAVKRALDQVGG